jgi:hypothetical protein
MFLKVEPSALSALRSVLILAEMALTDLKWEPNRLEELQSELAAATELYKRLADFGVELKERPDLTVTGVQTAFPTAVISRDQG